MSEGEDWADRVLAAARLGPGDDVLDLGDGVGRLAFAAHELVGDGWVIAVDPSVDALEALLRGAHERGAAGIMYLVGDVEVLPLPDGSVDACIASSALARTDDPDEAARELHRIVRPGGRLSLLEPLDRAAPLESLVAAGFADVIVETDESGVAVRVTARRG